MSNHEQAFPPNLLRPISQREFVVVTQDENEGAQVRRLWGMMARSASCSWTVASTILSWMRQTPDAYLLPHIRLATG